MQAYARMDVVRSGRRAPDTAELSAHRSGFQEVLGTRPGVRDNRPVLSRTLRTQKNLRPCGWRVGMVVYSATPPQRASRFITEGDLWSACEISGCSTRTGTRLTNE